MRRQLTNWSRKGFRSSGVLKTSWNLTCLSSFKGYSNRSEYAGDHGKASSERDQCNYYPLVNCFTTLLICVAAKLNDSCSTEASTNVEEVEDTSKPIYRRDEIRDHSSKEKGIWVTLGNKVYDITKFVVNHPGGQDKIMLAAGGSAEPFWKIYRQHYNSQLAPNALKPLFIGYLHPDDYAIETSEQVLSNDDPYSRDPSVSPIQTFHQRKPINSETPPALLSDTWVTPKEMWFNRNHHPVPNLVAEDYRLSISGPGIGGGKVEYTLEDLKTKFKKHKVTSAIQCGGNRRSEMNSVAVTAGSPWGISAISNAHWEGARLVDVLRASGAGLLHHINVPASLRNSIQYLSQPIYSKDFDDATSGDEDALHENGVLHVQFAAAEGMEASIPLHKALNTYGDVLLAYEMNGETLPHSHGYPIRVVVPGHVGVRNVKWLTSITLSGEEAQGPWQRGMAYKGFGPSTKTIEGIDVEAIPSLQEQPVQSAIMIPKNGSVLHPGQSVVQGYAYSGGGRGIVRVDVSSDGGNKWTTATLTAGREQPLDRAWAWTFWDCLIDIPEETPPDTVIQIICKATDASYNVQPETVAGIWNLRGINNNAWHRVNASIVPEDIEPEEEATSS